MKLYIYLNIKINNKCMYYFMHAYFMCHVCVEELRHKSQNIKISSYKLITILRSRMAIKTIDKVAN